MRAYSASASASSARALATSGTRSTSSASLVARPSPAAMRAAFASASASCAAVCSAESCTSSLPRLHERAALDRRRHDASVRLGAHLGLFVGHQRAGDAERAGDRFPGHDDGRDVDDRRCRLGRFGRGARCRATRTPATAPASARARPEAPAARVTKESVLMKCLGNALRARNIDRGCGARRDGVVGQRVGGNGIASVRGSRIPWRRR